MPKMKTHRGAAKRFKKTGTGKTGYVSTTQEKAMKKLLPYL